MRVGRCFKETMIVGVTLGLSPLPGGWIGFPQHLGRNKNPY